MVKSMVEDQLMFNIVFQDTWENKKVSVKNEMMVEIIDSITTEVMEVIIKMEEVTIEINRIQLITNLKEKSLTCDNVNKIKNY